MNSVEVKKDIHWVGAVDWSIRDFHGYTTYKGTTYNSYLLMDEKVTLFDSVKKGFTGEMYHRILQHTPPEKIDYLVVNHVEPDHSGSLPEVMERIKPKKLFCSPMGKKALIAHYHREDWPYEVVKSGDKISTGKHEVVFLETRMLHWPDSMFSYLPGSKLLISSDAFGHHWATSQRFDDEVSYKEVLTHSAKYFANILNLYSPLILKLLKQVREMGLEIDTIAPDHGIIWRSHSGDILEAYERWANQETLPKVTIVYDSMWHSTETMGRAIMETLIKEGIEVKFMDLKVNHRSDIMTEILTSRALLCGSATLNNGMMPYMADVLHYVKGLKPTGRIGAAFGSYGWSGEAVKIMNGLMEEMGIELVHPGVRIQYVPTHESLQQCTELGLAVAKAVREG